MPSGTRLVRLGRVRETLGRGKSTSLLIPPFHAAGKVTAEACDRKRAQRAISACHVSAAARCRLGFRVAGATSRRVV